MTPALPFTIRLTCRSCASLITSIFDLGKIVPSDFLRPDQPDPPALPLDLCRCDSCGLVQLRHTVNSDSLFRNYWYLSSTNEVMRAELFDIVEKARAMVDLSADSVVVDVGANDGTLLSAYARTGSVRPTRLAYEPAYNLFDRLKAHADVVEPRFFPPPTGWLLSKSVSILTSIAMFYDLDDPQAFVREVDRILTEDGVWVVQFQDLAGMVRTGAFDNIGFEHLCYYSLATLDHLLNDTNLAVTQVETRTINGGSLRVYIRRPSAAYTIDSDSVQRQRRAEQPWTTLAALEQFVWRAAESRTQLREFVYVANQIGPVDLYAASTKSSTLLQYCEIDHSMIRQAVERTTAKVGLVTSGTRIPIVSEETWRADPAPTTLIGAWQFASHFIAREDDYLKNGGRFLTPLPHPTLVSERRPR